MSALSKMYNGIRYMLFMALEVFFTVLFLPIIFAAHHMLNQGNHRGLLTYIVYTTETCGKMKTFVAAKKLLVIGIIAFTFICGIISQCHIGSMVLTTTFSIILDIINRSLPIVFVILKSTVGTIIAYGVIVLQNILSRKSKPTKLIYATTTILLLDKYNASHPAESYSWMYSYSYNITLYIQILRIGYTSTQILLQYPVRETLNDICCFLWYSKPVLVILKKISGSHGSNEYENENESNKTSNGNITPSTSTDNLSDLTNTPPLVTRSNSTESFNYNPNLATPTSQGKDRFEIATAGYEHNSYSDVVPKNTLGSPGLLKALTPIREDKLSYGYGEDQSI